MKFLVACLLLSLSVVSFADDEVIFPAAENSEPSGEKKTLVVIAPEAVETAVVANGNAIGQDAWAALSLTIGTVTGLKALIIPLHLGNFSIGVEGIFGAGINPVSGLRETFGGGVRGSFTVASDGVNDALLISPGVDILFANGTPGRGLAEYSPYGHVYFVAANTDISWVHQFAKHFGVELGARVGGAVAVNDGNPKNAEAESLQGKLATDVGVFTGLRF